MKQDIKKKGIGTSVFDALKPSNWLMKILIILGIGLLLAGRELLFYWNKYFISGEPIYLAFYNAYKDGLLVAFASLYTLFTNLTDYINQGAYPYLIFGIILLYLVGTIIYQPVSFLMNLIDGDIGETSSLIIRILITLGVIIGMSAFVHFNFEVDSWLTTLDTVLQPQYNTINDTLINITNNVTHSNIPIITLGE
jgi:hypothetical protein